MGRAIIFFDGVCNLCNGFVDFLIRHDRARRFRYASLQGETARKLLRPEQIEKLSSVILYEDGATYERSDALIRILRELGGGWRVFGWMPRFFGDGIYRLTAENRYRLFGRRETCRLPTDEERVLFLD